MLNAIQNESKCIIESMTKNNNGRYEIKDNVAKGLAKYKIYTYVSLLEYLSKLEEPKKLLSEETKKIILSNVDPNNHLGVCLGIEGSGATDCCKKIYSYYYSEKNKKNCLLDLFEDKYFYFRVKKKKLTVCEKDDNAKEIFKIKLEQKDKTEEYIVKYFSDQGWEEGNSEEIYYINIGKKIKEIHNKISSMVNIKPSMKNISCFALKEILEQNKQLILQGPPGTGKTRMAKIIADILVQPDTQNEDGSESLDMQEFENVHLENCKRKLQESDGQIKLIQFHPSYGYEDFIMGVSVNTDNGKLFMEGKKGAIKEFADKIIEKNNTNKNNTNKKYVLIIDEINRAPIGTVMGELLYALEKRGEEIQIQSADDKNRTLQIPDNLYIIGTMNTADKSLVSMDYAMRRRFAFINIYSCIPESNDNFDTNLYEKVSALFKDDIVVDGINPNDIMLGVSYFLKRNKKEDGYQAYKIEYEIVPILREYYKDGYFKKNKKIKDKLVKTIMASNESLIGYLQGNKSEVKN